MGPLAILAGVGTVLQIGGAVRAAKAQKKAAKVQEQQERLRTLAERRQQIRESRILRARAEMTAVGSGAQASSATAGGIGSISSQLGSGLGLGTQLGAMSAQINKYNRQIMDANTMAAYGQMFTSIAGAGGYDIGTMAVGAYGNWQNRQTPTPPTTFAGPRPQARPF